MSAPLVLVSHALCPYVQRAAIVLAEKDVPFERRDIDLGNKPDWFLKVSPLGKTPVLLVGGQAIFESAVICEYLEDTLTPALHPTDPLLRARHRAWIEFASATLNGIGALYNAPDAKTFELKAAELRAKFQQLEAELALTQHSGPFFSGKAFSLVDAAFGPVFRYFNVFDTFGDFGILTDLPRLRRWREALHQRPSVRDAVQPSYPELLTQFLRKRNAEISRRMPQAEVGAG